MDIDKIIEYFDLSHENHKMVRLKMDSLIKQKIYKLFIKPREIDEKIRLFSIILKK